MSSGERVYIGIDPGLKGAVAVIRSGEVELHDVPTRKATKGEVFVVPEMVPLLRPYSGWAYAVLEEVSAPYLRSEQGKGSSGNVTTSLKIGRGAGLWEGMLAMASIAYELVPPGTWKREFRLVGQDKTASRALAMQLFPHYAAGLAKRRPDFAEALLIAEYCRRRWER